ncbi:WSC domain-containing protein [Immersiella caudata]|uniref:WSC domain-containing protein n=1 Tax=Immersiella caudata TaxID=314043 RepID=A0AA39XD84_9PEZI|nr:WSC domain-containing protein [Immersiella caudata]
MLGCYDDLSNGWRTLADDRTTDDGMTLEMCKTHCVDDNGYPFFGVEYGEECHCGWRVDEDATRVGDTQCGMPCNGDASQTCGDDRRLNVYGVEDTPDYRLTAFEVNPLGPNIVYQGCYTDDDEYEWALSERIVWSDGEQSVRKCAWYCFYEGFNLFGAEEGGYCMCGTSLHQDSIQTADSECDMPCTGDGSEKCGGPYRLSLYEWNWSNYRGSGGSAARGAVAPSSAPRGAKLGIGAGFTVVTEKPPSARGSAGKGRSVE